MVKREKIFKQQLKNDKWPYHVIFFRHWKIRKRHEFLSIICNEFFVTGRSLIWSYVVCVIPNASCRNVSTFIVYLYYYNKYFIARVYSLWNLKQVQCTCLFLCHEIQFRSILCSYLTRLTLWDRKSQIVSFFCQGQLIHY